jgi:hypothetical protein
LNSLISCYFSPVVVSARETSPMRFSLGHNKLIFLLIFYTYPTGKKFLSKARFSYCTKVQVEGSRRGNTHVAFAHRCRARPDQLADCGGSFSGRKKRAGRWHPARSSLSRGDVFDRN